MIFWAGHNGDSNVHDLQNFAWPFCMILHDLAYFVMYTPTYQTKFFMIFCMTISNDFSWFCFLCYVYPYISYFMIFWATQWLNYCLGFSWFSKTNFWEVVKMLIFLAYFGHSALCYSQDYWLPLFRNIVSVDTSFIFKASLHYTKCNTSTTMHNFILINKWKLLCRLWPLFTIELWHLKPVQPFHGYLSFSSSHCTRPLAL